VHDQRLGRMALQILENHIQPLAIHLQGDDMRIKGFVVECALQIPMGQGDREGFGVTAVDDGGHLVREPTQAAARTLPLVGSRAGIESEFSHCLGS